MGKLGAFKDTPRELPTNRVVAERVKDYKEIHLEFSTPKVQQQAARCMNCGIPFCNSACPLGNLIPEWNDLVYRGQYQEALRLLLKTNSFPEFTGRVCPAPCEEACVLNIDKHPVAIKVIEEDIIEHAFKQGWIKPEPPLVRTNKKVAVIGSGPAGLACAAQLNQAGHNVTLFERADRIGGLLIYGIPNFKLDKTILQRRQDLLKAEGVNFATNANIGFSYSVEDLRRNFNALVFCCGATQARELNVPGRELKGIYHAMQYLPQQNKINLGDSLPPEEIISAKDKHVIILGGGDTGADCLGTALRQGAKSVRQFELLPEPPRERTLDMPWPTWPFILRASSAHEESAALQSALEHAAPAKIRDFSICTKSFSGENGLVKKLQALRVEWLKTPEGRLNMQEISGSEFEIECDLCLLAMGFVHPEHSGPIEQLQLEKDQRGNVKTDTDFMTNVPGIFAAGDMHRGQSLVVWAIHEGREAARCVDLFLMGRSDLGTIRA